MLFERKLENLGMRKSNTLQTQQSRSLSSNKVRNVQCYDYAFQSLQRRTYTNKMKNLVTFVKYRIFHLKSIYYLNI